MALKMTHSPPCPLCQKTFLARRSLLRHLRNVHGRHDHRELVPSSKAGHDVERARNKLGRFVRSGDEDLPVTPTSPNSGVGQSHENADYVPTVDSNPPAVSAAGTATSEAKPKPPRKRLVKDMTISQMPKRPQIATSNMSGLSYFGNSNQQPSFQLPAGLQGMGPMMMANNGMPMHHGAPMMAGLGMPFMQTMPGPGSFQQYIPSVQFVRYPQGPMMMQAVPNFGSNPLMGMQALQPMTTALGPRHA
jgi:hypothetical protein